MFLKIEALDLNFLIRPNSHNSGTVRNCFMLQELFAWFCCFPICSSFFPMFWVIAYVWLLLLDYDRLTGVWRVDLSRVLSANHLHQHCRQVHTLIISLFVPSFYALVTTLKHCMSRINNMWVFGSSWWGRNLLPCIKTLGVTITLCLLRHAMLVDVDWVLRVFMTDVRLLINGLLKVAT